MQGGKVSSLFLWIERRFVMLLVQNQMIAIDNAHHFVDL